MTRAALMSHYAASGLSRADLTPGGLPAGRRFLVCVRSGDGRSYRRWNAATVTRDWDLLVSLFGRQADAREPECEWVSVGGLSKWIAFEEIFALRPDLLDRYESFFFPDDDLRMTPADIDRLFAITMTEGLALAQPALDWASYASHSVTIRRPFTCVRYTNFVELMAPVFRRDALASCLPILSETVSGWGVDYVWSQRLRAGGGLLAIVDAVAVRHPGPVDTKVGAFYSYLRTLGVEADVEMDDVLARFGITPAIRVEGRVPDWSARQFVMLVRDVVSWSWRRMRVLVGSRLPRRGKPADAAR